MIFHSIIWYIWIRNVRLRLFLCWFGFLCTFTLSMFYLYIFLCLRIIKVVRILFWNFNFNVLLLFSATNHCTLRSQSFWPFNSVFRLQLFNVVIAILILNLINITHFLLERNYRSFISMFIRLSNAINTFILRFAFITFAFHRHFALINGTNINFAVCQFTIINLEFTYVVTMLLIILLRLIVVLINELFNEMFWEWELWWISIIFILQILQ